MEGDLVKFVLYWLIMDPRPQIHGKARACIILHRLICACWLQLPPWRFCHALSLLSANAFMADFCWSLVFGLQLPSCRFLLVLSLLVANAFMQILSVGCKINPCMADFHVLWVHWWQILSCWLSLVCKFFHADYIMLLGCWLQMPKCSFSHVLSPLMTNDFMQFSHVHFLLFANAFTQITSSFYFVGL